MVHDGLQVALVFGDRDMLLATRAVEKRSVVCTKEHGYHGRWVCRIRGCVRGCCWRAELWEEVEGPPGVVAAVAT